MFLYHLPKKIFPAQFPTSSITISLSSLSHVIVQFFLSRHGCTFSGLFTEFLCWAHDLISLNTISIAQKLSYLTFHSLLFILISLQNMKTFSPSHQNPTLHSLSPFPLSSPRLIQYWFQSGWVFLPSFQCFFHLSSTGLFYTTALYRL